jgi:hypothetical protein
MALEFLGQYWNPTQKKVCLLGKGDGAVHDLTPHLPYPSARDNLKQACAGLSTYALLQESAPFPSTQAVLEAEARGTTVPALLAPAWDAALKAGKPLDESSLSRAPSADAAHLVACVLPLRAQAFGVTYENSSLERAAEGDKKDYGYVYRSVRERGERCEVFIKGTRLGHFFGPNGWMGLRSDLTNSMDPQGQPKEKVTVLAGIEPELGAVTYSDGRVLGYTLCNDGSGNQIENESILYLYQAKYFAASMGIGPWLLLSDEQDNPGIKFAVKVFDDKNRELYSGEADTRLIGLAIHKLIAQAASHNPLYPGEVFSTGTNIVPGGEAKVLHPGWRVEIRSERLGTFSHQAAMVSASENPNLDYHRLEREA